MESNASQKQIAEECLKKARTQLDEYEKTRNKNLLHYAYSNLGFVIYSGLNASIEVQKLKSYGMDVSKINDWKLKNKDGKIMASEKSFGSFNSKKK